MERNNKGQFIKGNCGFWLGKKRPGFKHNKQFKKNMTPWNKGISRTKETKLKISIANKGKGIDAENKSWKGKDVGYVALHDWVHKRLIKPEKCPKCQSKRFIQLSNISREYKRDLNDWQFLCAKCHYAYDRK